jgi:hypothetical protein
MKWAKTALHWTWPVSEAASPINTYNLKIFIVASRMCHVEQGAWHHLKAEAHGHMDFETWA